MNNKNQKIQPKRLKGFSDQMPQIMEIRFQIMDKIKEIALRAGFLPVGTPALEYIEVLLGQGSDETDKQVYRFKDHGDREVGLRFDLTVPFARFVAEHQNDLHFPFKRLQMGDVWRGEKPQKGRYREFCQCDLDVIGVDSMASDIEILLCVQTILNELELGPVTLRLGNRVILSSLIRHTLFETKEISAGLETKTLVAVDKLDKIGPEALAATLVDLGAQQKNTEQFLKLILTKKNNGNSDLDLVKPLIKTDEKALQNLDRLKATQDILLDLSEGKMFKTDLSLARGLGYYTGIVFEGTFDELPGFGSIFGGGRYDDLASRFMNRHLPGVGGSIGLDRLVSGLVELKRIKANKTPLIFVAIATEDANDYGFSLAQKLRRKGYRTDIGLTSGKVANQFKLANKLNCPLVITVGSDEKTSKTFALKDMNKGEETKNIPENDLLEQVAKNLST